MTYYARNLPHWHPDGKTIFLTWRLFGSLPSAVLKRLETLRATPGKQFVAADRFLDFAESGPRWLSEPQIAALVKETILRGEKLGQYTLFSYVVMPNHVHVLLEPRLPLLRVTRGIKGVSARDANAALGRVGKPFWQDESFDHWIRSGQQFDRVRWYIENNPVKAGLAKSPKEWPWSSAR
ncbi:MAG TPA: transposase [Candidatus Acidoferrales bacterium]|nr:transposase [Candidatus Acidoferrales bacterium]